MSVCSCHVGSRIGGVRPRRWLLGSGHRPIVQNGYQCAGMGSRRHRLRGTREL